MIHNESVMIYDDILIYNYTCILYMYRKIPQYLFPPFTLRTATACALNTDGYTRPHTEMFREPVKGGAACELAQCPSEL